MKRLLSTLVLAVCFTAVHSQLAVKTDFLGYMFKNYSLMGEYEINPEMSVQLGIQVGQNVSFLEGNTFLMNSGVRFYMNSRDEDTKRFFVAPVVVFRNFKQDSFGSVVDINGDEIDIDRITNGLALSLDLGKQWSTQSGFVFEAYFGVGRYLVQESKLSRTFEDPVLNEQLNRDEVAQIDFRLGVNIGFRFNQKRAEK